jgi:flagellar basal-body rod protein FlgG
MNRAMFAAASGMAAQQRNLDVVADNLANADVAGFKSAVATFGDVRAEGNVGLGTASLGTKPLFEQGKLEHGGGPFDVALDGPGFFVVEKDGATAYTRGGSFTRDAAGLLVDANGRHLHGVRVPADATNVRVAADGRITLDLVGRPNVAGGRVPVVRFDAPERLRPLGGAVFAATPDAGPPHPLVAGDGRTRVAFGMLERANVSIVAAMMQIMTAQRAYEANAKGVQAADEMQRIANNLHRS